MTLTPMLLCRFAQTTAAVLLSGTVTLRLLARGTGLGGMRAWDRLAFGSWGVFLVSGVFQLWLTAAEMSGLPLAQACTGEVLGSVLEGTRFGAVWRGRMCLLAGELAVLLSAAVAARRHAEQRTAAMLDVAGMLLTSALLASLVWVGHANASAHRVWLLPVDLAHVIAAGAWPGGLLPLTLLLARARRDSMLVPSAITITRRFSRLSVAAVGILALSGLLNACGLVETFALLWPSAYGRWLLCKAAFFAAMVGLGSVNRKLIGKAANRDTTGTLRLLWRNVACECALAVAVLLATELLATTAPPAGM